MLALNSQMCATSVTLSYFHVHTAINILRCFGYPREHNFGLVLILSPTGCTEGCVYFPQSCRNTHLPHFLDCLLNTTLIPCLLVFFLSILHERVCDYSRVQSSVTGIPRMGDMNIHITWLPHVRTGPKKKNRSPAPVFDRLQYAKSSLVPRLSWNANIYRAESLVSFVRKHDVSKIGQKQKGNVCALFNQLRFNARCV